MVQIAITESVARVIAERVAERRLSGPSDYIQELVEADTTRATRRRIDQALLEALTDDPASDLEWNKTTKATWRWETKTRLESGATN